MMDDNDDVIQIETPVLMSKEERKLIREACKKSFITEQDFIQAAVDAAILKLKESGK